MFVQFVAEDSPAAMAGVRFGDQVLTVNDEVVAGYSADKVHKLIKKAGPNGIRLAMRDRWVDNKEAQNNVLTSFNQ